MPSSSVVNAAGAPGSPATSGDATPITAAATKVAPVVPSTVAPTTVAPATTVPLVVDPAANLPEPVVAGRTALVEFGLTGPELALVIDPSTQTLFLSSSTEVLGMYPVGTGRGGLSGLWDSNGTPTGALEISAIRFGEYGETFFHGQPTGEFAKISNDVHGWADMTSRLLILSGLEAGNESTRARGIYIHGTNLEGSLGQPLSHGCVRIGNDVIVRLADVLSEGTLVFVLDRPYAG